MASLLFEVGARDPIVIASVVATVDTIGIAACVVAARRADDQSRRRTARSVEPVEAGAYADVTITDCS